MNEVRGKKVGDALNYLHFSPKKGSDVIEKTLRSAVSNLLQKADDAKIDPDSLIVSEAFVNGGPHMKRFRPASMGRISRLNKPTSHVTVVVCEE
jgi:large subunit ribosomal protein L22